MNKETSFVNRNLFVPASNCAILAFKASFEVVLWPSSVFVFFKLFKIYIFQTAFIFALLYTTQNTTSFPRTIFLKKKLPSRKYFSFSNFSHFFHVLFGVFLSPPKLYVIVTILKVLFKIKLDEKLNDLQWP